MATPTRPYIVTDRKEDKRFLIDSATSQAHAVRQLVADRYTARPASAAEVLEIMRTDAALLKPSAPAEQS